MDGAVSSPRLLQQALQDKVLRQCYLLDADVTEHTKETLVYSPVKLDDQGNIRAVPHGGRRRIDYILFDKEFPVVNPSVRLCSLRFLTSTVVYKSR